MTMTARTLALAALVLSSWTAAPAAADTIAITGATIYQRSDRKLDSATIVIRDGKIADVGPGLAVPAGATRIAAELAAARVPVLLDPTANLPGDLGALDVRDDNATVLARAGVAVAISTLDSPSAARTIRQLAGIAVAQGLPWPKGLAAITEVPAQIYGGAAERGTLERGKIADVVVWSGDPLELTTRAEVVIIGGAVQSLVTHQSRLLDRYKTLPKQ